MNPQTGAKTGTKAGVIVGGATVAAALLATTIVFNTRPGASSQTPPGAPLCAARPGEIVNFVAVVPPQPLPTLPFFDKDGTAATFADRRGRGLVINFWATWCAPCVKEMPDLDRLSARLKDEGIDVLPLSSDREGASLVEKFYARIGLKNLPILLDRNGAVGRALNIRGLPTTILADRQGREVARVTGIAAWDSDKVADIIRRCVGPQPGHSAPGEQRGRT